ncbi:MAG: hypothetical protein J1E57_04420 [Prevotella sp.]|nr:hypothetical protein [Prevotella sp.]
MKKIVLTVMAMFCMVTTFAENAETKNVELYNMDVNMRSIQRALSLNKEQTEQFADLHKTFCAEMMFAANAKDEDKVNEMVRLAVNKDLKYMSYILNTNQYRKYIMLLNATMRNRGLLNNN